MEILKYSEIDLAETIKRSEQDVNNVLDTVSEILNNVKDNGDDAVKSYTEKRKDDPNACNETCLQGQKTAGRLSPDLVP